ncbi:MULTISPECIES: hypothetical protein [unclassified Pseudomonas]|uniref:hypothetical protein n=1 Tax=unclassified Pseudomonas TaxID=196821 RepID=UPI002ACB16E7|nr:MULTISPECIES: hypothetical protein [unclassified Pseudomonas]MEB0043611.1 hypothetical protein [Pseudomonas sp. MH10]MEB0091825.1 hypothetical protein [Pseudomonas sp. CCI4.2]MEB0119242.1 hypothetical protein [Pseudomonas sp. CCI1.2]WPX54825.1 hypothetical protein RHM65_04385 [Pseudomonas sp. CCI4.2]WPX62284.1 hypothetical protein RHM59_15180 [Pseudomonas sp. MH10]
MWALSRARALFRPAILPNLAKAGSAKLADLKAHWVKGDMIVLVRHADIFSSPLTRAARTSGFMFNYASAEQSWLFDCRKTMLTDTLSHKVRNRNLVLVFHSECFTALEKLMNLPASKTGDYGYASFLTVRADGALPKVAGIVDATDWQKVVGK